MTEEASQTDAPLAPTAASKGIVEEILAERNRQISAEGWSATHDDTHQFGELPLAAASYAIQASDRVAVYAAIGRQPMRGRNAGWINGALLFWPWDSDWWKPKGARRDLIRAGALIVAEIERLDRLGTAADSGGDKLENAAS